MAVAVVVACMTVAVPLALAAAPSVTIEGASNVEYTTAIFKGTVDPGSESAEYRFQYVSDEEFANSEWSNAEAVGGGSVAAGAGPTAVETEASGLRPGITYHLRLVAENPLGETSSAVAPTFTTKTVTPPTATLDPVSGVSGTTAHFVGHVNPNAPGPAPQDPAFETQWRFECNPECEGLVGGSIAADDSSHEVSADATGLNPNRSYEVRLIAENRGGLTEAGPEPFNTPAMAPTVITASNSAVSETEATVSAQILPGGLPTTAHIEYGLTAAYGQSTAESLPIGSDNSAHEVLVRIAALQAGTTYHWRVVASNGAGVTDGPDRTFTTFTAPSQGGGCPNELLRLGFGAQLPDCRAYEQASPIDKNGGNVGVVPNFVQAAEDGGAVTFYSLAGLPGGTGAQDYPAYLATRGRDGWSTQGLYPPASLGDSARLRGWSPDLSLSFAQLRSTLSPAGFGVFERNSLTGAVRQVTPFEEPRDLAAEVAYVGISKDDRVVTFEDTSALTPGAVPGRPNLYVLDRSTGSVRLAGALNDGSAPTGGAFAGPYAWFGKELGEPPNTELGGSIEKFYTEDAISGDGRRVSFTASGTGQLYVRTNVTEPQSTLVGGGCSEPTKACTLQASASQKTNGTGVGGTDPAGPAPAAYLASPPESPFVYFSSPEELTNNANTGSADQGRDLYRYDTSSGKLLDLAPDFSDPNGAEAIGLLGTSADGSYVYFAANGVLAPGATAGNCEVPVGGQCNLYMWHDGALTYIARLDADIHSGTYQNGNSDAANWEPRGEGLATGAVEKTARVSSDGRVLLFRSQSRQTAFDNGGIPELYRYEAGGSKICVSCSPGGALPTNPAEVVGYRGEVEPSPKPAPKLTRNLSADGSKVFFQTSEPLVPGDTNSVTDVYEWEKEGGPSCPVGRATGCLFLLSPGNEEQESLFGDASASGDDVFIFTYGQLVGQDRDGLRDAYDVKVDGGLASQAGATEIPCVGSNCRGELQAPSPPQEAGSSHFLGAPDQKPKPHKRKKHHKRRQHKGRHPRRGGQRTHHHNTKRVKHHQSGTGGKGR
ncbi:MAG: hypothetical protein JST53_18010 [Actinobacteria bacterium]|nr:hypothetical protein [Actinomycetota bacterium]